MPIVEKKGPVINAGINGFIVGSFTGGVLGAIIGVKRMFKYHKLSKFPATVLAYGLTTGISLGIVSSIMK